MSTAVTLDKLLPRLAGCSAVVVTGPQRSGTRIASHILAEELRLTCVEEQDYGFEDLHAAQRRLRAGGVVVQAPCLAHRAHEFECPVVFMIRSVDDIVASQQRIGWGAEEDELRKYDTTVGPIARVKYQAWRGWQRAMCAEPYDLLYESLAGHPLWVPKERRREFHAGQWRLRSDSPPVDTLGSPRPA